MKRDEIEIAIMKEQLKVSRDDIHEIKSFHIPAIYDKLDKITANINNQMDMLKKDISKINTKIAYYVGGATILGWVVNLYIQAHR